MNLSILHQSPDNSSRGEIHRVLESQITQYVKCYELFLFYLAANERKLKLFHLYKKTKQNDLFY